MLQAGKTHLFGNLPHGQLPSTEQNLTFLNADFGDVLAGGGAQMLLEQHVQVGDTDMYHGREFFQTELLMHIFRDDLNGAV